uniref:Cupin type-1 domain-containing protein n=1 Tax=Mantoniella antarctica TaxID=81844 RepID=A0A7S0ST88_9CHLO|mmetsp:Transcript_34493/g.86645  ORF Transcript_34493/g.86645 Transcript_34493/m.86645 type:complete len:206 (+) Transcript_34493:187-804(+)|eukprot:CAMPEP_0181369240 /NCGR_PEP_ID=MMETSP1106-20121128/12651_1 /TAXON_ID=81844 /ORGANISM="Mantoniella antarctica, Strain SL-175" /LENGTH=205 /DNA_ID=CAMNT_0023485681 /DNA_START=179 /DNA_END=796 /DNA_ORIENTATION=+
MSRCVKAMLSRKAICCAASLSIFAVAALYFGAAPIFSLLLAPMSIAGKVLVPDTVDKLSQVGEGVITLAGMADVRSGGDGHWMESLFHAQDAAGLVGAAAEHGCRDMHVGTVGAGRSRGNHRHHNKNETIILWGAAGIVRVERPGGVISDFRVRPGDRVLVASPSGLGHAIKADRGGGDMMLIACADAAWDPSHPATDYQVWNDW